MQNLKKNKFVVKNWQEFGEFNLQFVGPLFAEYIRFDLKSTEELSFMAMKCHEKFEEELTHGFKNNMRNLVNFYQST